MDASSFELEHPYSACARTAFARAGGLIGNSAVGAGAGGWGGGGFCRHMGLSPLCVSILLSGVL